MSTWRSLFTQTILKRGKEYYRAGKAKKLTWESDPENRGGDIYEATVRGTRNYHVVIKASAGEIQEMSCTCPYASDGNLCKHEAAVLLAIEDEYEKLYVDSEEDGEKNSGSAEAGASNRSGSGKHSSKDGSGGEQNDWSGKSTTFWTGTERFWKAEGLLPADMRSEIPWRVWRSFEQRRHGNGRRLQVRRMPRLPRTISRTNITISIRRNSGHI